MQAQQGRAEAWGAASLQLSPDAQTQTQTALRSAGTSGPPPVGGGGSLFWVTVRAAQRGSAVLISGLSAL